MADPNKRTAGDILKLLGENYTKVIQNLFNTICQTGVFPDYKLTTYSWKNYPIIIKQ